MLPRGEMKRHTQVIIAIEVGITVWMTFGLRRPPTYYGFGAMCLIPYWADVLFEDFLRDFWKNWGEHLRKLRAEKEEEERKKLERRTRATATTPEEPTK